MPIRFAPASNATENLVRARVADIARRPQAVPAALRSVNAATLQTQTPHAVYDLRLDEIAEGGRLETAKLTGTRYLITSGPSAVAAAEVHSGPGGSQLVANVNFGPFVDATARAFQDASRLSAVGARIYEPRLLRFSAIQTIALWLKAEVSTHDILYPLAPAPAVLKPETPYTVDDFFTAIAPLVRSRLGRPAGIVP